MIKLIVALGNHGSKYENTRHNIGWLFLDYMPFSFNWQKKFKGEYASVDYDGRKIYFLKPHTYMNLSGESVAALCSFFGIKPEEILVLHDDLESPFGVVKVKIGGGLGGHNGLRSLKAQLGTPDFMRLKMGISRPSHGDISGYVLSKFNDDEQAVFPVYMEKALEPFMYVLENGIEAAEKMYRKFVAV